MRCFPKGSYSGRMFTLRLPGAISWLRLIITCPPSYFILNHPSSTAAIGSIHECRYAPVAHGFIKSACSLDKTGTLALWRYHNRFQNFNLLTHSRPHVYWSIIPTIIIVSEFLSKRWPFATFRSHVCHCLLRKLLRAPQSVTTMKLCRKDAGFRISAS